MSKNESKQDRRKLPAAERGKPTTGQSGEPLKLGFLDLNPIEQKIVTFLKSNSNEADIASIGSGAKLNKLQVRNGLRRPVRAGFIKKTNRGAYRLMSQGISAIQNKISLKVTKQAKRAKTVVAAATKAVKTSKNTAAKVARQPGKSTAAGTVLSAKESIKALTERVEKLCATSHDTDTFKAAMVVQAAIENPEAKDTTIAKITGLKRGFVETRLKRIGSVRATNNFTTMLALAAPGAIPPKVSNGAGKAVQPSA